MDADQRKAMMRVRRERLLRQAAAVRGELAGVLEDAERLGVAYPAVCARAERLEGLLDRLLRRLRLLADGNGSG